VGHLLEEKLEISSEKLSEQLSLFFLSAVYNLSKTQIFSKQSLVEIDGLASEEEYQRFWNSIAESGIIPSKLINDFADAACNCGAKPLWIEIQNAFYDTCRELFIEGFKDFIWIILDDDKMHDSSKKTRMCGLKKTLHVRDNRTGCVAHTLVYTASGLPIGIEWECAGDDSTTAATERLIRSQLAPMHGDTGPPNLTNTALCMDRGYINPRLLYDFIMPSGAEIMGTCKRQPMFPFTYEQVLNPNDPPQDVPMKGQKALLLKNLKIDNKQLSAFAYRDGKGGVTLGINAMIRCPDWDLVVVNSKDAEHFRAPDLGSEPVIWYHEFNQQNSTRSSDFDELFLNLNVTALIMERAMQISYKSNLN
jgi:hypothetical protein